MTALSTETEQLPIGAYRTTRDGAILEANPALARLFGFPSVQALQAQGAGARFSGADREAHLQEVEAARGGYVEREWTMRGADGQRVVVRDVSRGVFDEGRLVGTEGWMEDITQAVTHREELEASRERYRELLDNAMDVIYVHDLEGRFVDVNRAGQALYGYSADELRGMELGRIIDAEYLDVAKKATATKLEGKSHGPYELLTRRKDGRPIWVEVASRVMLEKGKPIAIQGIARDITIRKTAEGAVAFVRDLGVATMACRSLDHALATVLERVARWGGWEYAEAWMPNETKTQLDCHPVHFMVGGPDLARFRHLSEKLHLEIHEGAAGRVWTTRQPLLIPNLASEVTFHRASAARAAGLVSGLFVPVVGPSGPVAVLGFMDTSPGAPGGVRTAAAMAAAELVGAVMSYLAKVEENARHRAMLRTQLGTSPDGCLWLDARGQVMMLNRQLLALAGIPWDDEDPGQWDAGQLEAKLGEAWMQVERLVRLTARPTFEWQGARLDARREPLIIRGVVHGHLVRVRQA